MTTNAFLRPQGSLRTTITATGNGTYDLNPAVRAGLTILRLQMLAGGTGAGGGRKGAAGTVRCAGGPGANGAFVDVVVPISVIMALFPTGLIPYNVGPGTAGGVAVTTDDTNGNAGAAATVLTNGTWFGGSAGTAQCIAMARPGNAGSGGTALTGASGFPQQGTSPNATPGAASTTGGVGPAQSPGMSGCGGGITAGDVPGAGGSGGGTQFGSGITGIGGVVGGAAPTSGTIGPLMGPGAAPGGGAASITGNAQAGADALATSGAGGASGGASLNGAAKNGGAGGAGGSGFLRITAMP